VSHFASKSDAKLNIDEKPKLGKRESLSSSTAVNRKDIDDIHVSSTKKTKTHHAESRSVQINDQKSRKQATVVTDESDDNDFDDSDESDYEELSLVSSSKKAKSKSTTENERTKGSADESIVDKPPGTIADIASLDDQDRLYLLDLLNECPRCGLRTRKSTSDKQSLIDHLIECNDSQKHKAYKKQLAFKQAQVEEKSKAINLQADVQTLSAFKFLGAQNALMWTLNDKQVKDFAKSEGVDVGNKTRTALLTDLTQHRNAKIDISTQLENKSQFKSTSFDSSTEASIKAAAKYIAKTGGIQQLPAYPHMLPFDKLKEAAACLGLPIDDSMTKDDVCDLIEDLKEEVNQLPVENHILKRKGPALLSSGMPTLTLKVGKEN
jgi:hypothetical protein